VNVRISYVCVLRENVCEHAFCRVCVREREGEREREYGASVWICVYAYM